MNLPSDPEVQPEAGELVEPGEVPLPAVPESVGAPVAPVPPLLPVDAPPNVWVVVLELLAALVLGAIGQGVIGLVTGFVMAITGQRDPYATFQGFAGSPWGLMLFSAPMEAALVAVALFGASRMTGDQRAKLGLGRSGAGVGVYVAFFLGTVFAAGVGTLLTALVPEFTGPREMAEKIWGQITWASGIPYVLYIALVPGFAEELFFRGYVQRRLLRCWRPWAAIAFSSVAFALYHMDPSWMLFALPIGVWLGVLAWRTGSIWPGVVCHAALNGLWNAWFIGVQKGAFAEWVQMAVAVGFGVAGVAGFVVAIVVLVRMRSVPAAAPPILGMGASEGAFDHGEARP